MVKVTLKRVTAGLLTLVFSTLCCAPRNSVKAPVSSEFIAGCLVLTSPSLSRNPKQQAAGYRQLVKITGVQAREAQEYLAGIRDNPKKFKELYDFMQKRISPPPDTTL